MDQRSSIDRRRFLRGVGGVVVGLPALDIFQPRTARAQAASKAIYSAFMVQQNGAVQGVSGEPQQFWPTGAYGPIDAAKMAGADAAQTTSVLKDHASKLLFLRGASYRYDNNHVGGNLVALTAGKTAGPGTRANAVSESVDSLICRTLTPGRESLVMYAGRKGTYRDDAIAFGPAGKLIVGDNNPWNIYQRIMGLSGMAQSAPGEADRIAAQRLSVNDVVRTQLKAFLGRTDLSKTDRERLDLHLTSVRDMEKNMTGTLGPMVPALNATPLQAVNGTHTSDDNMEAVVRMMLDITAFSFASDRTRSAALQIGGGNDHTRYTVNGEKYPPYHFISHRVLSDGGSGTSIPDAVKKHHEIDLIHARFFKHLLDRMAAYQLPSGGTLLDNSVNMWVNSIADGPPHGGRNIPHVLAGGAGGFLKTGQHLNVGGWNNKILNTIATAAGVRKPGGGPIDDFGDPDPAVKGLISEVLA